MINKSRHISNTEYNEQLIKITLGEHTNCQAPSACRPDRTCETYMRGATFRSDSPSTGAQCNHQTLAGTLCKTHTKLAIEREFLTKFLKRQ